MSVHSSIWMHAHTLYPYELLWRTKLDRQISRFIEVITDTSLSTDTLPTTKRIASLNPEINLGKCEYLCQVGNLNPVGRFHYKKPNQLISYAQFFVLESWDGEETPKEEEKQSMLPHLIYSRWEGLQKMLGSSWWWRDQEWRWEAEGWATCKGHQKWDGLNHVMETLNKVKMEMNDERQSEYESICTGFVFNCPWRD